MQHLSPHALPSAVTGVGYYGPQHRLILPPAGVHAAAVCLCSVVGPGAGALADSVHGVDLLMDDQETAAFYYGCFSLSCHHSRGPPLI